MESGKAHGGRLLRMMSAMRRFRFNWTLPVAQPTSLPSQDHPESSRLRGSSCGARVSDCYVQGRAEMRSSTSIRRLQALPRGAGRARYVPLRECVPVGDVTDCLSAAYECVSRLIGEKPLWGEVQDGQDVEDCRKAEDRWMPWLMVDLGESERFVYALASVPGDAGKDLSIGLEAGWLAILAQRENSDRDRDLGRRADAADCARGSGQPSSSKVTDTRPEQTFCVMSLPAEVNPTNSIAVLAKGVLGIRMPKARA